MDVLFHVLDESRFQAILRNLSAYTGQWLFVGTWNRNPRARGLSPVQSVFRTRGRTGGALFLAAHPLQLIRSTVRGHSFGLHQRYEELEASFDVFLETGLRFVAVHPSPLDDGINAVYVFQRQA